MKKKKSPERCCTWIAALGLMLLSVSTLNSQNPILKVFEDWNTVSGSQDMFQRSVTRSVPGTSNVVVAGATINPSNGTYDIFVEKISGSGSVLWSQTFNGPGNGNDIATDVRVASNGEIYVAGTYFKDATDSSNAIVLKYGPNGNYRWQNIYNGSGSRNDAYSSLLVSGASVVAVGTCWSSSNQYDMVTRRLDTAGTTTWTTTYDNSGLADGAVSLANRSGSIFVTGGVQTSSTAYKIATWKLNPTTGAITTTTLSTASSIAIDRVNDVQEDASGNVYVAGTVYNMSTGFDFKIFKYDASLSLLWSHTWDGSASLNDGITGLALDQNGSVIVTGYTGTASGNDFATVKYSSAGSLQWASTFDGGGSDSATCIVVNQTDTNKIYVSGYSYNGATNDYHTIRYDGAGTEKWSIGFNSIHNANDVATAIALDTLNNIIVTGQNEINDSTRTYATVKYIEHSTLLPRDTISATSNSFIYTENRGQLYNTIGDSVPQVRYYVIKGGPQVYFTDTAISYVFCKLDTSTTSRSDTLVRVDMKYLSANADIKIRAMDVRSDYENFFTGELPEGRSRVPDFDKLVSFNVWNNVDVMYGSNLAGMKTYFICKPGGGGGSYGNIDLKFNGADSVKIDGSGQLIIYTKLGNIVQPKAAAWQIDGSGNFSSLGWQPSYNLVATGEIKFNGLGSYNSSLPLIFAVDWGHATILNNNQNLMWSTFYGGGSGESFTDVKVTTSGKQIVCGQTHSIYFPTLQALQATNNGATYSGIIVSFFADHHRDFSTYFGGGSSYSAYPTTIAWGIDADNNGDIFFTGETNTTNFPPHTWGSAYFQSSGLNGCSCGSQRDAFIVKLSADGQSNIWSTLYGGDKYDVGRDIKLNPQAPYDWYFAGQSTSTNFPFPNTLPVWSDGSGFFVRSSAAGVPVYGSYIGNDTTDIINGIAIDQNKDVVFVGKVASGSSFPVLEPSSGNVGNSTFGGGGSDAFIIKFNHSLTPSIQWSTYYGSTSSETANNIVTQTNGVSIDYYVVGEMTSISPNNGLPSFFNPGSGAYFQNTQGGGFLDAFVMKFDINGNIPWATLYGGNGDDKGYGIALDNSGNLYIAGSTESSDLSTATFPSPNLSGAYVDGTRGGTRDLYLACFRNSFAPVWGTYYGGGLSDDLGALTCNGDSSVYLTGGVGCHSASPLYSGPGCIGTGTPYFDNTYLNPSGGNYSKASIAEFCLDPVIAGIATNEQSAFDLNFYPNPTSGMLTITGNLYTEEAVTFNVFNLPGQIVYTDVQKNAGSINLHLDLSSLANGIYIVQVRSGDVILNKKIIIQR